MSAHDSRAALFSAIETLAQVAEDVDPVARPLREVRDDDVDADPATATGEDRADG